MGVHQLLATNLTNSDTIRAKQFVAQVFLRQTLKQFYGVAVALASLVTTRSS
jgi:hypothetical protein